PKVQSPKSSGSPRSEVRSPESSRTFGSGGGGNSCSSDLSSLPSTFYFHFRSQLSPFDSPPSPVAAAAGLCFGAAAGGDEQNVPGRGGNAVSLGAAAGALLAELHNLLR